MIDRKSTLKQLYINALNFTCQTLLLNVVPIHMKQQVNDYDHSTVLATKRHKEPTQTNTHTHTQLHREE